MATDARTDGAVFGSDPLARLLRELGFEYLALNPGASYRGLHDSLVNLLGNERPRMLLCLHEEHAVALAHGYAKVSGRPLAVALHSNVGLLHASMALYNAWCDRVPMLVLGATGPLDAARRRPWIDWIHTSVDQGALARPFLKFDDQPGSVPAALESLLRANLLSRTAPCGPVYVCLDADLQEQKLAVAPRMPEVTRHRPPPPSAPDPGAVEVAAKLLSGARAPLLLAGRVSRDARGWEERVGLAEDLGARVLTDLKLGAAFPTDHPLHVAPPAFFPVPAALEAIRAADVILSLDWLDLAGTLAQAGEVRARIIQCSIDHHLHRGGTLDHQGLPAVDVWLAAEPDAAVPVLRRALRRPATQTARGPSPSSGREAPPRPASSGRPLGLEALAGSLRAAVADRPACLIRLPLGWPGDAWAFRHPLDSLGYDGGGGIGSGPGMAVGAALALRGTGRLPIAVLGDGDLLMGASALWTAASEAIPLLVVVANNRSYLNDELHQERVARARGRPVENRWIGQRIDEPAPDLAGLARSLGLEGAGPVGDAGALDEALRRAVSGVSRGETWLVDVLVAPRYASAMSGDRLPDSRGAAPGSLPSLDTVRDD